jgi:carbon storage regulator
MEEIRIGDSITIKVLRVQGDKVRLGIEAPADTKIMRTEIEGRNATK